MDCMNVGISMLNFVTLVPIYIETAFRQRLQFGLNIYVDSK